VSPILGEGHQYRTAPSRRRTIRAVPHDSRLPLEGGLPRGGTGAGKQTCHDPRCQAATYRCLRDGGDIDDARAAAADTRLDANKP